MSIILNRRSDNVPVVFETKDLIQSKINSQNNTITINGVQYNFSSLREIQDGTGNTIPNRVIGFAINMPIEPQIGDRYIVGPQHDPCPWDNIQNYIVEYIGSGIWEETAPIDGMSVRIIASDYLEYVYRVDPEDEFQQLKWIPETSQNSNYVADGCIAPRSMMLAFQEVLADGDMIYKSGYTFKVLSAQNVLEGSKLIIGQNGLPQYCNTQPQYKNGTTPYTLAEFQALTTCKIGERYIVDTDGLGEIKCVEVVTKNPETHVVVYSIFHDLYDHSR